VYALTVNEHGVLLSDPANIAKRVSHSILAFALIFSASLRAAYGYYFQGYYCPTVLVSPMHDDTVYTPVGLGVITSKAGFRVHPITGKGDFHSGVDLAANLNDKVYNLLDGMVMRVGWRGALGVAVEIYHPYPNVRTICGHLNAYSVRPGEWVQRGRVIGYAGSTGRSTGVHVHYTVVRNDTNQYIEPVSFIKKVPQYLAALNNARTKAAIAMNMRKAKEEQMNAKNGDSDNEDLPAASGEAAPPDVIK
jgi:murein DD-endopeptidase MepM/ murein hydrolase activator NlpD